ncbi:MAG: putative ABC transporter permease [Saezia sp.]
MYLNTTIDAVDDQASLKIQAKKEAYNLRNLNTFYFLIYAMIGWLFEVIYCFAVDGVFVNRGLLYGPYLPVYGFGAIIVIGVVAPRCKSMVSLFFVSMAVCTVLEYFTSWYMETVFNVSLWNYSEYFLNINGRVCLWNTALFGILALVVMYVFQPFFNRYLHKIPGKWRPLLSIALVLGLVTDFVFSAFSVQELASRGAEILVLFS